MRTLLQTNINTPAYWDKVYSSEIAASQQRVALDRFERVAAMIPSKSKVLDVGCGTGEFVRYLVENRPDCTISACDFSKTAIDFNKKLSPTVDFKVADVNKLSSEYAKEFDFVACFETLEHVDNPQHLATELQKVTKSEGTFVITTPYDNLVAGGAEHINAFKYDDFLSFFNESVCFVTLLCRYSENYKNLMCVVKML